MKPERRSQIISQLWTPNIIFATGLVAAGLSFSLMAVQSLPKKDFTPHRTIAAITSLLLASSIAVLASAGEEEQEDESEQKRLAKTERRELRLMAMEADLASIERQYENEDEIDELEQEAAKIDVAAPYLIHMANMNAAIEAGTLGIYAAYGLVKSESEKPHSDKQTYTGDHPKTLPKAEERTIEELLAKGYQFIDTLVNTTLSNVFLGIPGTGKSTILGVAIGRMRQKYGSSFQVQMIAMKEDRLLDIEPIVLHKQPQIAFKAVMAALTEHRLRAAMPKHERLTYAKANPYRLILDDYTSQQQKLDGIFKDLLVEYGVDENGEIRTVKLSVAYEDALNELWFNGRETNVGIWVGTHSETVDDLKFVSSRSGRSSGMLCFMGRRDRASNQGHYDIVSGNLKHFVIPSKEHLETLKKHFPDAMQLAYENDKPLALISGIDNGAYGFAIIPDLTDEYKNYLSANQPTSEISQITAIKSELPNLDGLSPEAIDRIKQVWSLRHNLELGMETIIGMLWEVTPADGERWQYAKRIYLDMCRLLLIEPDSVPVNESPPQQNPKAPSQEKDFSHISTDGKQSTIYENREDNRQNHSLTGSSDPRLDPTIHQLAKSLPDNSGSSVSSVPFQQQESTASLIDNCANSAPHTPEKVEYTPMQLPKTKVLALIGQMKLQRMSQTKIIETLWWVTKSGTNPKWKQAREEYRLLTGE